jgi:A/G-specific adenine glycosylase
MTPADVDRLQPRLLAWYQNHRRDLPWRRTSDPYRIWISEVMLQQTQVKTVLPYFERFCRRFPTLADLAAAEQQSVLKSWEGMGYYARARNFHRAARLVMDRMGGRIPEDWRAFRSLPGVGDYIAAAVLSIAFGRPHAVVDGNVKRVLARLFAMEQPVNISRTHSFFQAAADRLLLQKDPGTFNQAMMELGALVCTPAKPDCAKCPISGACRARKASRVAEYPLRQAQRRPPLHRIAVGVVIKNGRLLITRRPTNGLLGGLWEFPGGKIEKGESADQTCLREIMEEVNLRVEIECHLKRVKHAYTHFRIEMDVFCCRYRSGRVRLNGPADFRWIRPGEIEAYPFPKANHKFIPHLKKMLQPDA